MRNPINGRMPFLVMVTLLMSMFLSACVPMEQGAAQRSQVDQAMERGVLKVGLDTFVPWAFKDKDGNLAGFEIDVATKLAADMGIEVEFIPTEWSGIIPALLTNKFDVIIGGMGITTERALKVNFSDPYAWSGLDIVVNKEMIDGVTSLADLNSEDIVFAVRLGATPSTFVKTNAPNAQLHEFDTDEAVIQDVLNGNAHAAVSSSPKPAFWVADYGDVLYRPLGGELLNMTPSSFAIRKGDTDTESFFNSWILLNQDWLQERSDYWFGTKEWSDLLAE